jgi:hypothetical protein
LVGATQPGTRPVVALDRTGDIVKQMSVVVGRRRQRPAVQAPRPTCRRAANNQGALAEARVQGDGVGAAAVSNVNVETSGRTVNPSMIVEDMAPASAICVSSVIAAVGLYQHPEQRLMRLAGISASTSDKADAIARARHAPAPAPDRRCEPRGHRNLLPDVEARLVPPGNRIERLIERQAT